MCNSDHVGTHSLTRAKDELSFITAAAVIQHLYTHESKSGVRRLLGEGQQGEKFLLVRFHSQERAEETASWSDTAVGTRGDCHQHISCYYTSLLLLSRGFQA